MAELGAELWKRYADAPGLISSDLRSRVERRARVPSLPLLPALRRRWSVTDRQAPRVDFSAPTEPASDVRQAAPPLSETTLSETTQMRRAVPGASPGPLAERAPEFASSQLLAAAVPAQSLHALSPVARRVRGVGRPITLGIEPATPPVPAIDRTAVADRSSSSGVFGVQRRVNVQVPVPPSLLLRTPEDAEVPPAEVSVAPPALRSTISQPPGRLPAPYRAMPPPVAPSPGQTAPALGPATPDSRAATSAPTESNGHHVAERFPVVRVQRAAAPASAGLTASISAHEVPLVSRRAIAPTSDRWPDLPLVSPTPSARELLPSSPPRSSAAPTPATASMPAAPGARARSIGHPLTIQRQPDDDAPNESASPPPPAPSPPADTPDQEDLVERVYRRLLRRLTVESERRGGMTP